jgi:hypothetical protein
MEMNGKLHAPACLSPVPISYDCVDLVVVDRDKRTGVLKTKRLDRQTDRQTLSRAVQYFVGQLSVGCDKE